MAGDARSVFTGKPAIIAVGALLLASLLGVQALGARIAPQSAEADATRAVGRASFAYLSGIRTFAAAVLWNRLEPQFHEFYSSRTTPEQAYMLPTMRLVQTLDPNFEPVYSQAAWIVARRGDPETGIDIARDGVEANPRSGVLRANLAQILMMVDRERYETEALAQADVGMGRGVRFATSEDEFESLAVFAAVYKVYGVTDREAQARSRLRALEASGVLVEGGEGHDHDSDGTPDH